MKVGGVSFLNAQHLFNASGVGESLNVYSAIKTIA